MGQVKRLAEELAYKLMEDDDLGANPGGEREWREYFKRACALLTQRQQQQQQQQRDNENHVG